jgi:hypothetical protein
MRIDANEEIALVDFPQAGSEWLVCSSAKDFHSA